MVTLSCLENPLFDVFWDVPEFRTMYFRRIRSLLDGPLAPPRIEDMNTAIRAGLEADAEEERLEWGNNPLWGDDLDFLGEVQDRRDLFEGESLVPDSQPAAPGIVINELHYNPVDGFPEFLELFNTTDEWIDLSLWELDGVGLTIPGGTIVEPNGHIVFTDDLPLFRSLHDPGADYLVIEYPGGLKGGGELIELRTPDGTVIDSVDYDDSSPWEPVPDDGVYSLELADPALDNSQAVSWHASIPENGTPGQANSDGQEPTFTGTMARATTLEQIQQATDYNQAEHEDVLRLYAAFFNRQPDAAGARYWIVDIYEGLGANLDQIAAEFALSQEFQNTYGSVNNEEYLRILYQNVLLRQPDTAGFNYWLSLLDNGLLNRGSVVRWVAAGEEFERRVQFPKLTP